MNDMRNGPLEKGIDTLEILYETGVTKLCGGLDDQPMRSASQFPKSQFETPPVPRLTP